MGVEVSLALRVEVGVVEGAGVAVSLGLRLEGGVGEVVDGGCVGLAVGLGVLVGVVCG